MPFVYMLECHDGSFYVGSTARSPHDREAEHNLGLGSAYARRRGRRPVRLVWWEEGVNIDATFAREKQIQGWGRAKRLALIEGRVQDLPGLSRARRSNSLSSRSPRLDKLDVQADKLDVQADCPDVRDC